MSPNDVKAIKMCAELMGAPLKGYNPIENAWQAKVLAEKIGLTIQDRATIAGLISGMIHVFKGKEHVHSFSGSITENGAIVYSACYSEDPEWDKKKLFGIDFTFDAVGWEDAAGPGA